MTRIHMIGTIFVPVADQERSLQFYAATLGFEVRSDFAYGGGHRWIEVAPPGAANTLALVPPGEGRPSLDCDAALCALATSDIDATWEALRAAGADVDDAIAGPGVSRAGLVALEARVEDPVPRQCFFRDPDGNRFLLVQPT
jgi:catechol 2,3-dioxygenase-like lactoylglutathione lyase family enzyme